MDEHEGNSNKWRRSPLDSAVRAVTDTAAETAAEAAQRERARQRVRKWLAGEVAGREIWGRDDWQAEYRYDLAVLAIANCAEHADDADEIISREWIEREFPEWLRFYGGVGVASILIRQEGGNRWELQVWPYFGGECVCDIRLLREGCVPPQFQLDIGSIRTRGELRRLLKMLDRRVTQESK